MTHLPHLVQVSESPQGWLRSVMMRAWPPRPETFLVPAPSMCQQTRTQRVQRMQRLWSMPNSGCVLSTSHFGKAIFVADVVHALAVGQRLQFAMAVGHADRADVVPLGEQQLQRHPAVLAQPFAVGLDVHAFGDLGGAGGQQLGNAGDFHQAQPAGAHVINAFQVAERRDVDARFGRGLQDRRALLGADLFAVDG